MTMTLIETKTLASAATSITFTSIPQDGTDLFVFYSLRDANSNAGNLIFGHFISFNSSTSNFTQRYISALTASVGSGTSPARFLGWHPDSDGTLNTFCNSAIYIPNYAGSTNKSYSVESTSEANSSRLAHTILAGLWSDTSAITSLTISSDTGGNLAIGSTISLYKITKGSSGGVVVS
jgi:hypothetical protein